MSVERANRLYGRVYRLENPKHPKKGDLGPYGAETRRNEYFVNACTERVERGGLVLDAGCGRGHLMAELASAGYRVEGTELASVSVDNWQGFVHPLAYQELYRLQARTFDAVISSDVLEHIPRDDIDVAIANLARISKRWLFVSVGTVPAKNYPQAAPSLGVSDLHEVVEGAAWWRSRLRRFVEIRWEHEMRKNYFAFCTVDDS